MSVVSAPEVLFVCHIKISMSTMTIKTEMKCIFILKTKNSKIKKLDIKIKIRSKLRTKTFIKDLILTTLIDECSLLRATCAARNNATVNTRTRGQNLKPLKP